MRHGLLASVALDTDLSGMGKLLPWIHDDLMKKGFHHFSLGDFACTCISDGGYRYEVEKMFSNVPLSESKQILEQAGLTTEYVWTPYTYLFIDTGQQNVLIDMGAGPVEASTGHLISNMKSAGIQPEQVQKILITHAHPDHVGGALNNRGEPTFANAEYHIWHEEWDFWFSKKASQLASDYYVQTARKHLKPLQERMGLVDSQKEILPGFVMIPTPGHTPGHASVMITSAKRHLCYIGDVVLHPLHLEYPDLVPIYDVQPNRAARSKKRMFDHLSGINAWVVGQHFPSFPSLGHVKKLKRGWKWTV